MDTKLIKATKKPKKKIKQIINNGKKTEQKQHKFVHWRAKNKEKSKRIQKLFDLM